MDDKCPDDDYPPPLDDFCLGWLLSGMTFVRDDFCPGWLLSGMPFVRDDFCPGWRLSWMTFVSDDICQGWILYWMTFVQDDFCSGWLLFRMTFVWDDFCPGWLMSGMTFVQDEFFPLATCSVPVASYSLTLWQPPDKHFLIFLDSIGENEICEVKNYVFASQICHKNGKNDKPNFTREKKLLFKGLVSDIKLYPCLIWVKRKHFLVLFFLHSGSIPNLGQSIKKYSEKH